jgi:hypothetical protein
VIECKVLSSPRRKTDYTKTDKVETVVGSIEAATGGTAIPRIVVPGATRSHCALPCQNFPETATQRHL